MGSTQDAASVIVADYKSYPEKEDLHEEVSVRNCRFVLIVSLQCPSHLCVDYTPFTLLYLLFIYRPV